MVPSFALLVTSAAATWGLGHLVFAWLRPGARAAHATCAAASLASAVALFALTVGGGA